MLTRTDRYIVAFASAGVLLLFYLMGVPGHHPAQSAHIHVNGKSYMSLDLRHDRIITVPGNLGDSILQIENGRIRFTNSPCQGKQCLRMGWAHHGGETLVCLPNRISVEILATESTYDAVNF